VAVPTVAYVAENLGLEGIGYETALRFTNKFLMRKYLKDKIPDHIPEFYFFNDAAEAITFCKGLTNLHDYLVKPVNSQGSKGVYDLNHHSLNELISSAFIESRSRGILVEKIIRGFEYSVECYKQDNNIYSLAVTKKYHYLSNDCIDVRNTYLGDVSPELEALLFDLNKKVIEALELPFGVTHAEYKVQDGKGYLIEIAARGGGGSISSKIVPYLTGFEPIRALIHRVFKEPYEIKINDYKKKFVVMKFFDFKPGKIKEIYWDKNLTTDLLFFNLDVKRGDTIKKVLDSRDRPGYFVVAGTNRDEVLKKEHLIENSILIDYE
jgi:biotin carboxylase